MGFTSCIVTSNITSVPRNPDFGQIKEFLFFSIIVTSQSLLINCFRIFLFIYFYPDLLVCLYLLSGVTPMPDHCFTHKPRKSFMKKMKKVRNNYLRRGINKQVGLEYVK